MSISKSWSGWWKRARGKRAGLSLAHAARSAAQRPARWQPFEPLENRRMLSVSLSFDSNDFSPFVRVEDSRHGTVTINNGDQTPSPSDGTDFGSVSRRSLVTQEFLLVNGDLSGVNAVHITGSGASDFSVGEITWKEEIGSWYHFESNTFEPSVLRLGKTIPITFSPTATGKRTATVTLDTDDPMHPQYSFAIMGVGQDVRVVINSLDSSAAETADGDAANPGVFRISTEAQPTDRALDVQFKVSGSAKLGDLPKGDYRLEVDGTLLPLGTKYVTLPAGEDHVDVTVVPVDDDRVEKTEAVQMKLQSSKTYLLGAPAGRQAVVAITDNEPTLWVDAPDDSGLSGTGLSGHTDEIEFQVHRDGNTNVPVTFGFSLSGSAKAGKNYALEIDGTPVDAKTRQWTMAVGQTMVQIRILPFALMLPKAIETVDLKLGPGKIYSLSADSSQRTARATLLDAYQAFRGVGVISTFTPMLLFVAPPAPFTIQLDLHVTVDPPVVDVGAVSLPADETTGCVVSFGSSFVTDLDVHFLVAADDSASSTDSQVQVWRDGHWDTVDLITYPPVTTPPQS